MRMAESFPKLIKGTEFHSRSATLPGQELKIGIKLTLSLHGNNRCRSVFSVLNTVKALEKKRDGQID